MNKVKIYSYEENAITFSKDRNVMVNATEMAKPFGKQAKDWLKTQETNEFLNELSKVRKILIGDLVQVKVGAPSNGGGTWMHEDVAMEFARWLSPKFAIWCNDRIKELLIDGIVVSPNFSNPAEAARAWADEYERRQKAETEVLQLTSKVEEMQPKVNYYDTVLQTKDAVTTTQIASDYGMSAKAFNKKLAELGIQRKVHSQWILYSEYVGNGYTQSKTHVIDTPNGSKSSMWTYWTQKGRLFVYDIFKRNGILPLIER